MSLVVRLLRFALVGGVCFLVQWGAVHTLRDIMFTFVANAIAFVLSAQLNFVLSNVVTWSDRTHTKLNVVWKRYTAVALLLTLGNSGVFWALDRYIAEVWALLIATAVTTVISFLMNHFWVFVSNGHLVVAEHPHVDIATACKDGFAVFLPAHNEAENLPNVVPDAVLFGRSLRAPFAVIVVDDGSTDDTSDVMHALMRLYSEVTLVTHDENQGYGAALKTGFKAALQTGYDWIGFCDSDGQFKPREFNKLIRHAVSNDADVCIGFRIKRADGLLRLLMGRGWHLLSKLVLNYEATDVDCGFKVFRRHAVVGFSPNLIGEHATISPEMLTRVRRNGHKIVEVGVNHFERENGQQSGSSWQVVRKSVSGLYAVRRDTKLESR